MRSCAFLLLLLLTGAESNSHARRKQRSRRRLVAEGGECNLNSYDCSTGLSCICDDPEGGSARRLFGAPTATRSMNGLQCHCRYAPPPPPPPAGPPAAPPSPSPSPPPPAAVPVTQVIYSSGTQAYYAPSATGTATLVAGAQYTVQVEILRNDLGSGYGSEYVPAIYVDGTDIGWCAPDGGDYDCTFYTCSNSHTFTPASSTVNLRIDVTGHSWDCDCDMSTWVCSSENSVSGRTQMTATARYTFSPV